MTKLEYLQKATPTEAVYTWKALGSNIINDSTKIYNQNLLYYVSVPLSGLNGYLLYCKEDYIGNIDWTQGQLFDYDFGEITFGNNVVSPIFSIILTANEYNDVDKNSQEFINGYKSFVPYKNLDSTDKVKIKDEDYKRIISVLGTPFIREDELEYTRDEICDLAIRPALEEYFHWIPATKPTTLEVGQMEMDVDFPDDSCYAVVGVYLQQLGGAMNGNMLSPLFYGMEQALYSGMNYTGLSGSYTGAKKPKTQTNSVANVIASRANAQALINYGRRVHYEGPYDRADGSRYIRVWSNTSGTLNIWWAIKTLDFNNVQFAHRTRVFTYAQACVKELFANLRTQSKTDIPGMVDYKDWLNWAKETKETIQKEWKAMPKYSGVLRGSL